MVVFILLIYLFIDSNKFKKYEKFATGDLTIQDIVKYFMNNKTKNPFFPSGGIILWNSLIIPPGFVLCDGKNNTPNLSGQFVFGYDKNDDFMNSLFTTGGATNVALTEAQLPIHSHILTDERGSKNTTLMNSINNTCDNGGSGDYPCPEIKNALKTDDGRGGKEQTQHGSNGFGVNKPIAIAEPHNNMPPYIVQLYIMKT
jgi:microcystin-dependent protein